MYVVKVNFTVIEMGWLWSLQLHLSASSTVVSKECAHKCSLL